MQIVIYDDDYKLRNWMENIINQYIADKNITLALNTGSKDELTAFIASNSMQTLYFLDLVVGTETKGLRIASIIKDQNPANIVSFITQYPNKILFESKFKMKSLNLILKGRSDRMSYEIKQTIKYFYLTSYGNVLTLKGRQQNILYRFLFEEIIYIESLKGSDRVIIYYKNGVCNCPGSLNFLIRELDKRFFRCHNDIIINSDQIQLIDYKNQEIKLNNGISVPYSHSNRKKIEKFYGRL